MLHKEFQAAEVAKGETPRGLTLIKNLVDQASFNSAGNELTLVKLQDRASSGSVLEPANSAG